jgi:RimJ/RimL family protein N-acetyltransferase
MKAFLKDYVFINPQIDKCIIGPEPKNAAAIRMYEKSGFKYYKTIQIPDEDEPEHLMVLMKKDFIPYNAI